MRYDDFLLKLGNLDQAKSRFSFLLDAKYTLQCDTYVSCDVCPLPLEEWEYIDFCGNPIYISINIGVTLICVPGFF